MNGVQNRTGVGFDEVERRLELAQARLQEFGVRLSREPDHARPDSGADAVITLSRGDARSVYAVQVKSSMTLTALAHGRYMGTDPLLVIGDRITRRSAEAFREANIQFVDAAGNAFVAFDGVFVDVRGRVDPVAHDRDNRSLVAGVQEPNLFSRSRAQVIMALLAWPELIGGQRREIAAVAGTSLGQTHDVLKHLTAAGYLSGSSKKPARFGELLDLWTAAYSTGLGPRLHLARFSGDPGRPMTTEQPAYLSGESADGVDIARPATLTVYLSSWDPKLAIVNRWSTNPDRVPNVFVRRKFWVSPRPSDEDVTAGPQNAPWPLIYADLMAAGDPRLTEVAKTWRARFARPDWS
ncbi:hypothetical protein Ait01nite_008820 [Actinoplanes italicus]|nr:hypothetical protein Ait01nite_008820 [Actinoplanes italicus]